MQPILDASGSAIVPGHYVLQSYLRGNTPRLKYAMVLGRTKNGQNLRLKSWQDVSYGRGLPNWKESDPYTMYNSGSLVIVQEYQLPKSLQEYLRLEVMDEVLQNSERYRKLRDLMTRNVKSTWDATCRVAAVGCYIAWDAFDEHLDHEYQELKDGKFSETREFVDKQNP